MNAEDLILAERQRQIDVEGFDAIHDEKHGSHKLHNGAMAYINAAHGHTGIATEYWPFEAEMFKPYFPRTHAGTPAVDRKKCLIKAGAMQLAAIAQMTKELEAIHESLDELIPKSDEPKPFKKTEDDIPF